MLRRFALLFFVLLFVLVLGPTYCLPDDESLRQDSPLSDAYTAPYIASSGFSNFNHNLYWTGDSLSWDIFYRLLQNIPSLRATRAPPA